jgi:hypothetical protein
MRVFFQQMHCWRAEMSLPPDMAADRVKSDKVSTQFSKASGSI